MNRRTFMGTAAVACVAPVALPEPKQDGPGLLDFQYPYVSITSSQTARTYENSRVVVWSGGKLGKVRIRNCTFINSSLWVNGGQVVIENCKYIPRA